MDGRRAGSSQGLLANGHPLECNTPRRTSVSRINSAPYALTAPGETDMSQPHKAALVTGSATGAGRAIAVQLAKRGLAVAVNYSRSQKEAEETVALVRAEGVP